MASERPGFAELEVDVEGRSEAAVAYTDLVGPVEPGDVVVLNTTAVALGLGTGGFHLVVAVRDGAPTDLAHEGRVVKARYTPLQAAVRTVEETHRDALEGSAGLDGRPIVCAPLHSMVAPIAAGAKAAGAVSVAYVMTDGAALPGTLSNLVPQLRRAGLLDAFVTAGQAFGGELEAVTIWTGLLAAVHVAGADVVVVADGPGNLGTDTTWGVSALSSGHALSAADTLGGRPVAALRVSFADARERHRGVSHHSLTILRDVCRAEADVAVPSLEGAERDRVWDDLRRERLEERHQLVEVDGAPALAELERVGVAVASMGRTPADEGGLGGSSSGSAVRGSTSAGAVRRWNQGARSPQRRTADHPPVGSNTTTAASRASRALRG